jgi:hypothetical protein
LAPAADIRLEPSETEINPKGFGSNNPPLARRACILHGQSCRPVAIVAALCIFEGMSSPASFRDRLPPGLITVVVFYGLGLGFLLIVRFSGVTDFFFPKPFLNYLTIAGIIFGSISIIGCFHPEWRDWSRNDPNIGD